MIDIPNRIAYPMNRNTLGKANSKIGGALNRSNIMDLNRSNIKSNAPEPDKHEARPVNTQSGVPSQAGENAVRNMAIPPMFNLLRKGQKTSINIQNRAVNRLKVCFGWNVKDKRCDIDASAFLITSSGKVMDDSWFVFYGQTRSPDNSVMFSIDNSNKDREIINIDFNKLNPSIVKIVFVMTINEAFESKLNFSMIKDAYVRLIDYNTNKEIVSFKLEEYYENVVSMTIGELYIHNGQWKFNPVGNGVNRDLAGQCAVYGVEIS